MAWETRNGRSYYYRKVRKDGRIFSVYEGGGMGGEIAAAQDEGERAQATQTRAQLRQDVAAQDRIDSLIGESERIAERAGRAVLEAAGFHQHKRQWRRKRDAG